jgi:hypothetical protein
MLKSPSIVARVLDLGRKTLSMTFNHHAPSPTYDALIPPAYHAHTFATAQNFSAWLQLSLISPRTLFQIQYPLLLCACRVLIPVKNTLRRLPPIVNSGFKTTAKRGYLLIIHMHPYTTYRE